MRKDPLLGIFKTNERIGKMSEKMNSKLKEILHRCEVDRPILMRDKLDQIWEKENDDKIFDQFEVKAMLQRKKVER